MESVRHIPGKAHSARLRGSNDLIFIDDSESKPQRVLEAVIDEIDLQMVEETVECRLGVYNRG